MPDYKGESRNGEIPAAARKARHPLTVNVSLRFSKSLIANVKTTEVILRRTISGLEPGNIGVHRRSNRRLKPIHLFGISLDNRLNTPVR